MNIVKIWACVQAALFIGLGLFTLIKPNQMAAAMGFGLLNQTAIAELKANYGGLLCALGLAILYAGFKLSNDIILGLLALIYCGYACGRLLGVVINNSYDKSTLWFLSIEITSLIITLSLYYFKVKNQ